MTKQEEVFLLFDQGFNATSPQVKALVARSANRNSYISKWRKMRGINADESGFAVVSPERYEPTKIKEEGKMGKNEIIVNGVTYVPKSACQQAVKDELTYVIVRTYSAGVFAGYLKERHDKNAVVLDARRLWYWDGAASLSQLAMEGVKAPENCKFPIAVSEVILTEVIEIIPATEKARKSIEAVSIWKR